MSFTALQQEIDTLRTLGNRIEGIENGLKNRGRALSDHLEHGTDMPAFDTNTADLNEIAKLLSGVPAEERAENYAGIIQQKSIRHWGEMAETLIRIRHNMHVLSSLEFYAQKCAEMEIELLKFEGRTRKLSTQEQEAIRLATNAVANVQRMMELRAQEIEKISANLPQIIIGLESLGYTEVAQEIKAEADNAEQAAEQFKNDMRRDAITDNEKNRLFTQASVDCVEDFCDLVEHYTQTGDSFLQLYNNHTILEIPEGLESTKTKTSAISWSGDAYLAGSDKCKLAHALLMPALSSLEQLLERRQDAMLSELGSAPPVMGLN
ncbi:MAG: hypothetical protein GC136_10435 [Alphaproteobacteria bacterium]|nr:hypothetical protein [Alphaproteobacteria bacterium]